MVVDAILERNPEVSFKSAIDMDRVSTLNMQAPRVPWNVYLSFLHDNL